MMLFREAAKIKKINILLMTMPLWPYSPPRGSQFFFFNYKKVFFHKARNSPPPLLIALPLRKSHYFYVCGFPYQCVYNRHIAINGVINYDITQGSQTN